jgi:hypothetical protein
MEAKVKKKIILLSVLLHILFLAFWETSIKLDSTNVLPAAAVPPSAPLVFDLQQPEMPREVIATPADARTASKPQKADFLSDKNALARNQQPAPADVPLSASPFSRGDLESHDLLPQPPQPEKETAARPEARPAETDKEREARANDLPMDENAPVAGQRQPETGARTRKPFQLDLPGVPHNHVDSQAAESGGLSFNTYDWDFAPYMLALKERIGRNIFPPLAFTKLGMIDGDTMLRFKIYPDGRLADLELLGYTGHRTLMETSSFAVTASAPFPNLPADFPKSYLEVTAKFSYFIKR